MATEKEGYVYIMINASLAKNMLKIGHTTKEPEDRAKELSKGTGLPSDFVVAYDRRVKDCVLAEKLIHKELKKFRTTKTRNDRNREFFKMPLKKAIAVVDSVADIVGENTNKQKEKQVSSLETFIKKTGETGAIANKTARLASSPPKTLPANTQISYGSHSYQHKQYPGIVVAKQKIKTNFIDDNGHPISPENWHSVENDKKKYSRENANNRYLQKKTNLSSSRFDEVHNGHLANIQKFKPNKRESLGFWLWFIFVVGVLLICVYINFSTN